MSSATLVDPAGVDTVGGEAVFTGGSTGLGSALSASFGQDQADLVTTAPETSRLDDLRTTATTGVEALRDATRFFVDGARSLVPRLLRSAQESHTGAAADVANASEFDIDALVGWDAAPGSRPFPLENES